MTIVSILRRLRWPAFLLALLALIASHVDWARLGHLHAHGDGVVHHAHAHAGVHQHPSPHKNAANSGHGRSQDAPADSEPPAESSGQFLVSELILSTNLEVPPAIHARLPTDICFFDSVVLQPSADRHDPATARGPPAA